MAKTLPLTLVGEVSAITWSSEEGVHLFARNVGNEVLHRALYGSEWGEWESLGGQTEDSHDGEPTCERQLGVNVKYALLHVLQISSLEWEAFFDAQKILSSRRSPAAAANVRIADED